MKRREEKAGNKGRKANGREKKGREMKEKREEECTKNKRREGRGIQCEE